MFIATVRLWGIALGLMLATALGTWWFLKSRRWD
jgi:hypothetical protein